jgi:hypothetical protein
MFLQILAKNNNGGTNGRSRGFWTNQTIRLPYMIYMIVAGDRGSGNGWVCLMKRRVLFRQQQEQVSVKVFDSVVVIRISKTVAIIYESVPPTGAKSGATESENANGHFRSKAVQDHHIPYADHQGFLFSAQNGNGIQTDEVLIGIKERALVCPSVIQ